MPSGVLEKKEVKVQNLVSRVGVEQVLFSFEPEILHKEFRVITCGV